ncbi:MAG: hypothetical protein H6828_11505 [Planctomycetes bacterium]|nr:hypothetical protein [Planctomycetota bacterium]
MLAEATPTAFRRRCAGALLSALAWLLPACAGPGAEQHLAPFYTHVSRAGGGVEHEALAGAVTARRDALDGPFTRWGLRPLFLHYPYRDERSQTQFLYPLGRVVRGGGEFKWWLLPIADYRREQTEEGRKWSFLSLPGLYFARFPDGRRTSAWFPVGGHVEELLTWDELDFALWPLWMRSARQGRVTNHVLFPVLAWTSAPDGGGWRVWPLAGRSWVDDRYDRRWALWPVLNYHRENLKADPQQQQTRWTIFPLYAQTTQASYKATTVLWPFFGYARDTKTGFWAWDGPWPLVRIQRAGEKDLLPVPVNPGKVERTRFWPFWSRYEGDGLVSSWYAWPIVNVRHESSMLAERDGLMILPFWQSFDRLDAAGGGLAYEKLWPLYQYEREVDAEGAEVRRYMFPQLLPLWRWPDLDAHYSWLYELYAAELGTDVSHERALFGLWRREVDAGEDRVYVSGLWSRRRYQSEGARVSEHSLLFGLVRWRSSSADGLSFLRPAFPGPGWPLERVRGEDHE